MNLVDIWFATIGRIIDFLEVFEEMLMDHEARKENPGGWL